MKNFKVNLDAIFGLVLLLAGCSKIVDPLIWHRIEANYLLGFGLVFDILIGCILIANKRSVRVRQLALALFISYLLFLGTEMLSGNWTCNCFGGANTLFLPFLIDLFAAAYFAFSVTQKDAGTVDVQVCALLICVVVAAGVWYRTNDSQIQFVSSRIVDGSTVEWKKSIFVLANNTDSVVKVTGLPQTCSVIPVSTFPITIEPNSSTDVRVLVRSPGPQIRNFIDGKSQLFFEIADRTLSQELRWGLKL